MTYYPGGAKEWNSTIRCDVVKLYFHCAGTKRQTSATVSGYARLLDDLGDTPRLGLGDRSALLDLHQIAGCRLHPFNMGVVFF